MHLKICSLLLLCTVGYADSLLSNLKNQEIELDRRQAENNADKLQNDWISPIVLSYTKSKSNQMSDRYLWGEVSQIGITQPIFKSGGIYYAIKYADATRDYANISIDIKEKELVSNAISIVHNINKLDLQIIKQQYLLDNASIDVLKKEEQFKQGLLDSSELDNAILTRNSTQTTLLAQKEQKEELIKSLKVLSDLEYNKISLQRLEIPTKEQYLDNLKLKQLDAEIKQKEYLKNMTVADQLVTVALDVRYSKNYAEGSIPKYADDNAYYGATISVPIGDINVMRKIEAKKLEVLKAKLSQTEVKKDLEDNYETVLSKIDIINQKVNVSNKDHELYSSLLAQIQDKYSVGLVTKYDVDTLENSKKIKELDKKIYYIDKQLLLLQLYTDMNYKL